MKIDRQCHLPSNFYKSIQFNPPNVPISQSNSHVTSKNDDVTSRPLRVMSNGDHVTNRVENCQDKLKLETKTELELAYDKIKVKMDKNTRQKYKKTCQKDKIDSPIRSINDVLKYNSRESPIRKKSVSKVKMMVRDIENPKNSNQSKPFMKSAKKRLKKVENSDAGALHNQPQITTFYGKNQMRQVREINGESKIYQNIS